MSVNLELMSADMRAAALPLDWLSADAGDVVTAHYTRALTGGEQTKADAIIADPYYRTAHKPRPLHAIFADLVALSSQQQTAIWNDLNTQISGVSKYLTDYGTNAGPIFSMDWTAQLGSTSGGQKTNAQNCIKAMYTQDNPRYLVHPPFDSSINVPGDVPA